MEHPLRHREAPNHAPPKPHPENARTGTLCSGLRRYVIRIYERKRTQLLPRSYFRYNSCIHPRYRACKGLRLFALQPPPACLLRWAVAMGKRAHGCTLVLLPNLQAIRHDTSFINYLKRNRLHQSAMYTGVGQISSRGWRKTSKQNFVSKRKSSRETSLYLQEGRDERSQDIISEVRK